MLKTIHTDPGLLPFRPRILRRYARIQEVQDRITNGLSLTDFASGYLYFGMHTTAEGWVFREWAPNASEMFLVGDFSQWQIREEFRVHKHGSNWEIQLGHTQIQPGQLYKLWMRWPGGEGFRLPSYGRRMVQDANTKIFTAEVPHREEYKWKVQNFDRGRTPPFIYEVHVGMSSEEEKVSTFNEFRLNILPRIHRLGYNTIQMMAVQEHPYYGSFGYHVSNFFAVSSRFGTPEELKQLIDEAHSLGIAVIMDLVHSHSVKNIDEGLALFDGTPFQYFHDGPRRLHSAWDSLCFNYSKPEVIHFLLSNCKYWLEEYKFDGFRFDGVTSMMYIHHGMGVDFMRYEMYYDGNQDEDAITYLALANKLIHAINPNAITIAEDVSGMPGLASSVENGGYGFDFRLAMGIPDYWIKVIKELPDEKWNVGNIYYEMTNHRAEEKTIAYSESHDQALVGDKTIMFRLTDAEMYFAMHRQAQSLVIDRAMALHKMIRLIVCACSGGGYLNFMGNEFGHPEWIDFPREGNGWSYKNARRQWHLSQDPNLRFRFLELFDHDMIALIRSSDMFTQEFPEVRHQHEGNQTLAFQRGSLYFIFNFNPTQSFEHYELAAWPGNYSIILNTDRDIYGGFARIDESLTYATTGTEGGPATNSLKLYLPSRTALVLRRI